MPGASVGGAVTGAGGQAVLSYNSAGPHTLKAERSDSVRSNAAVVCVGCGAGTPSGGGIDLAGGGTGAPPPGATPPAVALLARNLGLVVNRRYVLGTAPRTLRGYVVTGGAALRSLRIRLRRYDRGHCSFYSLYLERFHPARCVLSYFHYSIPPRTPWSYLLPEPLLPGFYTLETEAVDVFGRLSRARTAFFVVGR